MKILIVSDTHKAHISLEQVLEREKPIDMLIHLGDVEGGADYIEALADCPVHIVAGNNDYFSDLPQEEEFVVEGNHIFITHGHYYYVSMGESDLLKEAKGRDADMVMYGHTHKPSLHEEDGVTILNPGSISYPRQSGRQKTYMIMEIDASGVPEIELKYV